MVGRAALARPAKRLRGRCSESSCNAIAAWMLRTRVPRAAHNTERAAVRWARTARSQPQWTCGPCRFRAPAARA
ncbi:hypothetical protein XOC_2276 [Xanthomonas oryzae pv. oryzicola BLS256]|uniref:Uncharacterized protein n=1 Tax=Xanthomonas oryzae pv. oryzicola (strain BLS256) TaxID=383407 RepID=G7TEP8_XANOB|nr:hypothetical protein XOC_2276 [Xanthomonas oryzae pv. oryzicola BLS256]QEO97609.1 hypothetical protein XOCgx_2619 [Xanthomonas oryzae pv. oryzicola]